MDAIVALASAHGYGDGGGDHPGLTTEVSTATAGAERQQAANDHAHHAAGLLLRRTAQQAPRMKTAAAAARRLWRCRVCLVECGGRDGLREHCMSDEHYDGLQLFGLSPDLFADRIAIDAQHASRLA